MNKIKINEKIPVSFQQIESFDIGDDRFLKVKIWICHTNENLNGSFFSKESIEEAIPSLSNNPILAFIEDNKNGEKDFSDHRQIAVKENGKIKIKYLGQAIGIIPESNNAQFEFKMCDDGIEREFLTVEGLVWQNKWDEPIDIFNRDIIKSQSMELHDDYEGHWDEDKLFHFTKFKFYGACALGTDVIPAMKNSTIEAQFQSDYLQEYVQAKITQFSAFTDRYFTLKQKEGGKKLGTENTEFTLTYNQLRDEIRAVLKTEKKVDTWGYEYNRYWFLDADESKVYAEDTEDSYRLVSFDYSVSGDKVEISFDSKSRVKITYAPFEEGSTEEAEAPSMMSSDRLVYEVQVKEHEVKNTFTEKEEELTRLREFEVKTLQKEREIAENDLFEQFSSQLSEEEIKPLKEVAKDMSLDEIEVQLFALVGKKNAKFSAKPKAKEVVRMNFTDPSTKSTNVTDKPYAHLL